MSARRGIPPEEQQQQRRGVGDERRDGRVYSRPSGPNGRQYRRIAPFCHDGCTLGRHCPDAHDHRDELVVAETRRGQPRACKRPVSQSTVDRYTRLRSHRRRRHFPSDGSLDSSPDHSPVLDRVDWVAEYAKYRRAANNHQDPRSEADVSPPLSHSPAPARSDLERLGGLQLHERSRVRVCPPLSHSPAPAGSDLEGVDVHSPPHRSPSPPHRLSDASPPLNHSPTQVRSDFERPGGLIQTASSQVSSRARSFPVASPSPSHSPTQVRSDLERSGGLLPLAAVPDQPRATSPSDLSPAPSHSPTQVRSDLERSGGLLSTSRSQGDVATLIGEFPAPARSDLVCVVEEYSDACPVCLEDIRTGDMVTISMPCCVKPIHKTCVWGLLKNHEGEPKCPLCRAIYDLDGQARLIAKLTEPSSATPVPHPYSGEVVDLTQSLSKRLPSLSLDEVYAELDRLKSRKMRSKHKSRLRGLLHKRMREIEENSGLR